MKSLNLVGVLLALGLVLLALRRCPGRAIEDSPASRPVATSQPALGVPLGVATPETATSAGELGAPERPPIPTSEPRVPESARGLRIGGHVVDSRSQPVSGVIVFLRGGEEALDDRTWRVLTDADDTLRQATTDGTGAYAFEGLEAGDYELGGGRFFASTVERTAPFRLDADLERDLRLEGNLTLAGTVVRAIPGAAVELELSHSSWFGIHTGYEPARRLAVLEDGSFRFSSLLPGRHRVRVRGGGAHGTSSFDFELSESLLGAVLHLSRGLTLAGRIELVPPEERRSVSLSLWHPASGAHRSALTSDGRFRFEDLVPGAWTLELHPFEGPHPPQRAGSGWSAPLSRREPVPVERLFLQLERDIEDFHHRLLPHVQVQLDVRLPPGATSTEGLLVASSGPLEEEVELRFNTATAQRAIEQRRRLHDGLIDRVAPTLELSVPPGEWRFDLTVPGYVPWGERWTVERDRVHRIDLEPLPGRVLTWNTDAQHYRVEARESDSRAPWRSLLWAGRGAHAPESPESQGPPGSAPSERPARSRAAAWYGWLPPGTYDLRVTSDDYAEHVERGVRIEASPEQLLLDFQLQRAQSIQGELETRDGASVYAELYLWRMEEGSWTRLDLKRGGATFHFRGLLPGHYMATLGPRMQNVVARWELGELDLVDQRIITG